jgi:hypothetical protein
MNPHLNYLLTKYKAAELLRGAEHARLAGEARMTVRAAEQAGLTARIGARLRLWVAGSPTAAPGEDRRAGPEITVSQAAHLRSCSCVETPMP